MPVHQDGTANLLQHFKHNQDIMWFCKNKVIRQLLLKFLSLELPKDYKHSISPKQWKVFYRTPMHQAPRNIWLKVIYNKIPCRKFLYQSQLKEIENDRCQQCNEVEDVRHLLMDCGNKLDTWQSIFNEHFSYQTTVNTHCICRPTELNLVKILYIQPGPKDQLL